MQDLLQKKHELEEKEREKKEEKLELIKKKDGSAIASSEVKQILQVI